MWPALLANDRAAKMVGTFGRDMPEAGEEEKDVPGAVGGGPVVGLRIPYNLPLQRYADDELPWVATANYSEPDRKGQTWRDP